MDIRWKRKGNIQEFSNASPFPPLVVAANWASGSSKKRSWISREGTQRAQRPMDSLECQAQSLRLPSAFGLLVAEAEIQFSAIFAFFCGKIAAEFRFIVAEKQELACKRFIVWSGNGRFEPLASTLLHVRRR